MKTAAGLAAFALGVFFSFVLQEFLPALGAFHGARILFVPMLFCYVALALPTWAMLAAAIYAGFLSDLMYLHVVDGQVEIALGWSIVYFVLLGFFAHGFQPAFLRGHWWIHILVAAVGTSFFLAMQFLLISFRRQGIVVNEIVAWKIVAPGLVAAVFSPLLHLIVQHASQYLPEHFSDLRSSRTTR